MKRLPGDFDVFCVHPIGEVARDRIRLAVARWTPPVGRVAALVMGYDSGPAIIRIDVYIDVPGATSQLRIDSRMATRFVTDVPVDALIKWTAEELTGVAGRVSAQNTASCGTGSGSRTKTTVPASSSAAAAAAQATGSPSDGP